MLASLKRCAQVYYSDLGSQFTSQEVEDCLQKQGIEHSFSQKGCPYDNACIESFLAILKKEEVHHTRYVTYKAAKIAIFQYIESWYNRKSIVALVTKHLNNSRKIV